MIAKIVQRLLRQDRLSAAQAERDAAQREAAEYSAAVQRILTQGPCSCIDGDSPWSKREPTA